MPRAYIQKEAKRVTRLYRTRNPFTIARELGIHLEYAGDLTALKGMYLIIKRNRFIILNANLDERTLRAVCAHEIGHDRFHRDLAKSGAMQEFMLYDMRRRPEYEANLFAADLLIDDAEILEFIREGHDVVHIAEALDTDYNMVLIKIDSLREQGYDVRAPYRPQSDFLRNAVSEKHKGNNPCN